MSDPIASITEKMKVVDRALKLEALKQKADMDEWGSGFLQLTLIRVGRGWLRRFGCVGW